MTSPPFDPERMLAALTAHGVEFIVVGGIAAKVHGARRDTQDLDCVVRRTEANLARVADAIRSLNARLRVAGLSDAESQALNVRPHPEMLLRIEISTSVTDAGELDILVGIPDENGRPRPYEEQYEQARVIDTEYGAGVVTADLGDIIVSRTWANRPKDRAALDELRQLLDAEQQRKPDFGFEF